MATTETPNPGMEALLAAARALAQCEHHMSSLDEEGYFHTCHECGATRGTGHSAAWEPTDLVAAVIAALPPGQ